MPLNESDLSGFFGPESYTRWSPLFPRMVLSDGAKYVAENGGGQGAYWLMDAIASHQPAVMKAAKLDPRLSGIQFWTLSVDLKAKSAVLVCVADSGEEPVVRQVIEYTDFDLPELRLYVQPVQLENLPNGLLILLPSEY